MKLLLLFSIICLLNKTHSLTDEEEISLNNLSWLYAQFSLTFDPNEINTSDDVSDVLTPSDSLVPLYNYFKSNSEVFDNYKSVLAFFDLTHLHKIVKSVSSNELERLLEERIRIHQNNIVAEDKVPLTFKTFYAIFKIIQSLIEIEPSDKNGYFMREVPKITSITTVPQSHPLMQQFCHSRPTNDKEVIRALKRFQLRQFQKSTKKNDLDGREAKMLTLNHDFTEELKGHKDPQPDGWTIHHMIPSKTIVEFYTNYFELLSYKSSEMVKHKRFDWVKINEISVQKILLVDAETLWTKYGAQDATVPVYNYNKNVNSRQEDFVRAWYRWPLGLLFYGPKPTIRDDDPSNAKNRQEKYNNQPNDFEAFAASIVGDKYFEKVKTLNTEILEFNKLFTLSSDLSALNKEAMKVYIRILTIHREAPWTNQIIAPFNKDSWDLDQKNGWSINREFRPTWEWGIKTLSQRLDMMLSTNDVNVGASTSFAAPGLRPYVAAKPGSKELRRRKRHHIEEINCSLPEPKNGFWCSPFYLRLNPMNYIYCKLSGHKNLHFF